MKRKEIAELTDLKLIANWYWMAVTVTKEANSRRGVSKKTTQEEQWYMDEICKRFGFSVEEFDKAINPFGQS